MRTTIICFLILTAPIIGKSQSFDNWDKIIITDSYGGWYSYTNEFQVVKNETEILLLNDQDSVLKSIDSEIIEELFVAIKDNRYDSEDPLKMFNKDSIWMDSQACEIWSNYNKDKKKYPAIVDSFAISCIKNYNANTRIIANMTGGGWTDDYPIVQIKIISELDTSSIMSIGQYPFMLPWNTDFGEVYNSTISEIIGEILPSSRNSNKNRLQGKYFESKLISRIFQYHIQDYAQTTEFRNKYPYKTKRLEKHFAIKQADLVMMGSIEWGGFVASECADIILTDSTISPSIQFSAIFGRRVLLLHSVSPLLREKKKLIKQLSPNPVFQYTIQNDSCLGEIHYVNHRSLSGQAKREFLRDSQSNNQTDFRGKMRGAIFYELTEYQNGKRSFSRWIFLKDGSIILWQLKGDFLMNLSEKYCAENGYVCLEIPTSEF